MARLEQRTDDLATDVRTLAPLVVAVAEVKLTISQVQREQGDVHKAVEAIARRLEDEARARAAELHKAVEAITQRLDDEARARAAERDQRYKGDEERRSEERRDSRNFRRTLIGIGIAAVLSPIGTLIIILAGGHA